MRSAIALVAVLTIAAIAVSTYVSVQRYNNYFEGMWSGDPGYLTTAGLSDFQLYIGKRSDGVRQGYLIMADTNGDTVANTAFELREAPIGHRARVAAENAFRTSKDTYHFELSLDADSAIPFPSQLTATISILDGTLTLADEQTVYAFLEKDMAASAAAAG